MHIVFLVHLKAKCCCESILLWFGINIFCLRMKAVRLGNAVEFVFLPACCTKKGTQSRNVCGIGIFTPEIKIINIFRLRTQGIWFEIRFQEICGKRL